MKYILLITSFLINLNCYCQEVKTDSLQKKYFAFAEKMSAESKFVEAVDSYFAAYHLNSQNELAIVSVEKMDSLISIVRGKLIKKWKGTWKLKGKTKNYLVFTDTEIKFYEGAKLLKTEKIAFNHIDYDDIYLTCWQLVFSNNEIWDFIFPSTSKENILYTILIRNESSEYLIKHVGYYKDGREIDLYAGELRYEKIK